MAKYSKKYYSDNKKKNYQTDKKIKELYHSMESRPGESYTHFKKRIKNSLGY